MKNKKLIAVAVLVAFLISVFPVIPTAALAAEEPVIGYLEISTGDTVRKYKALKQNGVLYLSAEDIGMLTGYALEQDNILCYTKQSRIEGYSDSIMDVEITLDGTVTAMGKQYSIEILQDGETLYLPLEKILYLLHAQWYTKDGRLITIPLQTTITEFLNSSIGDSIAENKVNQTDLLINGESEFAHNLRTSLAAVFNDFDPMMFLIWWPENDLDLSDINPTLNKQYEEALLQLFIDDQAFLDSYGQQEITKAVEKAGFAGMHSSWNTAKSFLDVPENLLNGAEGIDEVIKWIAEDSEEVTKYLKEKGDYDISFVDIPRLKAWSREMGGVSDAMSIINCAVATIDTANRSKKWQEDYLEQIKILTNFDDTGYNKTVTDRIKNTASNLLKEKENTSAATINQAAKQTAALFTSTLFDKTPIGAYFAVFNTGLTIAKTLDPDVNNDMNAADLAYMVDCLVKTEEVAVNEMYRSNSKLIRSCSDGNLNDENINRLRNCTMLSLRANLRNRSFIHYLNEQLNDDSNWTKSQQAQTIRQQIENDYVLLCELMATESTDRLLVLDDNFDNMYSDAYSEIRQKLDMSIFHEGEIPDYNKIAREKYNAFLLDKGYKSYTKEWLNPAVDYAILDINQDDVPELLINSAYEIEFKNTLVFTYDTIVDDIHFVEDIYHYGDIRYVAEEKAITYQWFNPTMYISDLQCYTIQDMKLSMILEIGFDADIPGEKHYFYNREGQADLLLNESEWEAKFPELTEIDFIVLPCNEGNSILMISVL